MSQTGQQAGSVASTAAVAGWRLRLREGAPRELTVNLPALPLLGYLVAAILPVGLIGLDRAAPAVALTWGLAVGLASAWAFPTWRRWGWLASVAMLGWSCLLLAAPWRSYDDLLLRDEAAAYADVEIIDADAGSYRLPGVEAPLSLDARILRLRLHPDAPWQDCRGRVRLRFDEPAPALQYGDRLSLRAGFRAPWASAVPGDFDYQAYLRGRGIIHVAYVDTYAVLAQRPSLPTRLRAAAVHSRDRVVATLVDGVADPGNQAVLAAMTLGYRAGLESADRDRYLRSGMIHLFAISGLHVGVLFALVMGLLLVLRVPFRWRYFLGPLLVFVYVLITGAAPSALRAWLMLAIWSAGRGFRLHVVPVNAVLVAAVILLLRPFNLFEMGFQFSFTIVICLILGWGQTRRLLDWLHERQVWQAGRRPPLRHWSGLRLRQGLAAICAMLAAWLGGIGLSAVHNQLFLPLSAATNLVAGLLVWPVFALAVLKVALAAVGLQTLALWLAQPLAAVVSGVSLLADLAAEHGGVRAVPRPAIWLTLAYHAALLALLGRRGSVLRLTGPALATAATTLAIAVGWPARAGQPAIRCLVPPGKLLPVLILQPPTGQEPVLLNTGDPYFAFTLSAALGQAGVNRIDTVILLDNTRDHAGGLPRLAERHPPRSALVLADSAHNLAAYTRAVEAGGGRLRSLDRYPATYLTWHIEKDETPERGRYAVTWSWAGDPRRYTLRIDHRPAYGCLLELLRDGETLSTRHYAYDSALRNETLLRRW